jgi:hypothetical protein
LADETSPLRGADPEDVPPSDGALNQESTAPTITCLSCGTKLDLSASFCIGCGRSRAEALTPAAPPGLPIGMRIVQESKSQVSVFKALVVRGANSGKASTVKLIQTTRSQIGIFARTHKWLVGLGCFALLLMIVGAIARQVVQAQIYAKASPQAVAEAYAQAVVSRDPKVLSNPDLFPRDDPSLPIVDAKLLNSGPIKKSTVPVVALNWRKGSAKAEFTVKWGSTGLSSTVQLSPRESSKWIIFRDRSWVVSTPAPVLTVAVDAPSQAKVAINGVPVGSRSSSAVAKLGKGAIALPTGWNLAVSKVGFYGPGSDETGNADPVLDATLATTTSYSVPYSVQVNASKRARAALRKCIRKDCNDLPYFSDSDLDIGNSFYEIYSDYTETENNYSIGSCVSASPEVNVSRPNEATVTVTCDVSLSRTLTYVTLYTYIPNDYNYEFGDATFTMEYLVTYRKTKRSARATGTSYSTYNVTS